MPYRTSGEGLEAPVHVLLVTSRDSGRWVVPKGNFANKVVPHVAAAREAEEEAGVRGAVCPTPLGTFRYRKLRRSGASLMADVQLFPLAVSEELGQWKEDGERKRRWFSLQEAADVVDEPDLRDLIRSFGASEFNRATRQAGMLAVAARKSKVGDMFGWFQRLLPKTGNFFDQFEAHATTLVAAADAVGRMTQGSAMSENAREIHEREHDADEITREVLRSVRETFLTPFDRSAVTALVGAMDDAIDEMQSAASAIEVYDFSNFTQEMKDMAAIIVDAARLTAEAMPLLRDVGRNGARLHELTERLVRMEGHADEIHTAGLKDAFAKHGEGESVRFMVKREIYKHLERICDSFEDVANVIDGIVIDHS